MVWGAIVMAVSGIMLWANNLMLRFLPKTWLDVATSFTSTRPSSPLSPSWSGISIQSFSIPTSTLSIPPG